MPVIPELADALASAPLVRLRQRKELGELFGFETRNKYEIALEDGTAVGFAAEQQKGFLGMIMRQFLGHWRTFDIHFFDAARKQIFTAHHPFRFFFQRLEVRTQEGKYLGAVQQRFSILSKKFDIEDASGRVALRVRSPFWKIWTFPVRDAESDQEVGAIAKKWSGLLKEAFTDADNFEVKFAEGGGRIAKDLRMLLLAGAVFVDLQYFEKKAR